MLSLSCLLLLSFLRFSAIACFAIIFAIFRFIFDFRFVISLFFAAATRRFFAIFFFLCRLSSDADFRHYADSAIEATFFAFLFDTLF